MTAKAMMLRFMVTMATLSLCVVGLAQAPASAPAPANAAMGPAADALEKLKGLEGEWEAPLKGKQEGKVMVNTFRVIGEGSAVVHSEWLDGKQLTATVFYLVGTELRADHFCDFQNQPHYVVTGSANSSILSFAPREITNLDAHPRHFHSTTWHFLDSNHLTQDWEIAENGKESKTVRMEFTRKK